MKWFVILLGISLSLWGQMDIKYEPKGVLDEYGKIKFRLIKQGSGSRLDSDFLDELDSTQFSRVDTTATHSAMVVFNGSATFSSSANFDDGTASTPSITFTRDTNTGLYRVGSDSVGFTSGGVLRVTFGTNGIDAPAGTSANPSIIFGQTGTGIFSPSSNQIGIVGGSSNVTFCVNGTSVGINTCAPLDGTLDIRGSSNPIADVGFLQLNDGDALGGMTMGYDGALEEAWIYARTIGVFPRTLNLNNNIFVQYPGGALDGFVGVGSGANPPGTLFHVARNINGNLVRFGRTGVNAINFGVAGIPFITTNDGSLAFGTLSGATLISTSIYINGQNVSIGTTENIGPSILFVAGDGLTGVFRSSNPAGNTMRVYNTAVNGFGAINFRDTDGKDIGGVGVANVLAPAFSNGPSANRLFFGTAVSSETAIISNNNITVVISTSGHYEFMGSTPTISN